MAVVDRSETEAGSRVTLIPSLAKERAWPIREYRRVARVYDPGANQMEDERRFRPNARLRVRFPAAVVNPKFSQFRHELNQVDLAGVVPFRISAYGNVMPAFATLERTRAVTQRVFLAFLRERSRRCRFLRLPFGSYTLQDSEWA